MSMIPFDDRDGQIWLNGALVPWREANVHILSHGLHYASGVFECRERGIMTHIESVAGEYADLFPGVEHVDLDHDRPHLVVIEDGGRT